MRIKIPTGVPAKNCRTFGKLYKVLRLYSFSADSQIQFSIHGLSIVCLNRFAILSI